LACIPRLSLLSLLSGLPLCAIRSEEHTSELQSLTNLVCRLLLEKKLLLRAKALSRLDASDERMGVPGQGEICFLSELLDDFYHRPHSFFFFLKGRATPGFNLFPPPGPFQF